KRVGGSAGRYVCVVSDRRPGGAERGDLLYGVLDVEPGTGRPAERVGAVVADGPEAEREPVGLGGGECHDDPPSATSMKCCSSKHIKFGRRMQCRPDLRRSSDRGPGVSASAPPWSREP